jgi:hypothetical protein
MISDVLSELEVDISNYLEDENTKRCYANDPELLREISDVLARIRTLRAKLDTPPPLEEVA